MNRNSGKGPARSYFETTEDLLRRFSSVQFNQLLELESRLSGLVLWFTLSLAINVASLFFIVSVYIKSC